MRAERTRAVTETFLGAVFCTRRVCYESSCTAERAGTATHHHYRRYNLDYISNFKTFACMQVHAQRRPRRSLGRAGAALPGPGTTSHHLATTPRPAPARLQPPLCRRGALTVDNSRPTAGRGHLKKRPSAEGLFQVVKVISCRTETLRGRDYVCYHMRHTCHHSQHT